MFENGPQPNNLLLIIVCEGLVERSICALEKSLFESQVLEQRLHCVFCAYNKNTLSSPSLCCLSRLHDKVAFRSTFQVDSVSDIKSCK